MKYLKINNKIHLYSN